jgi:hypothetical protein
MRTFTVTPVRTPCITSSCHGFRLHHADCANDGDSAGDALLRIARVVRIPHLRGPSLVALSSASTVGLALNAEQVTVADCCLVPQLYNARRFNVEL